MQVYCDSFTYYTLETDSFCVQAHYGLNANGTVSVNNTASIGDATFTNTDQILGWAAPSNAAYPGQLVVHLQGVPFPAPLWVLAVGPILNGTCACVRVCVCVCVCVCVLREPFTVNRTISVGSSK
jgi:hypothetical protein